MDKTLIILGPTAVGKTAVSLLLAERIGGEIISADAFQVYRGLDIATAKPSLRDLSRVPHHLMDILDPFEQYSAARFRELAVPLIAGIRSRRAVPIVVGGAGLYIKVLVDGIFESPPADHSYREYLRREEEEKGPGYLHRLLRELDPAAAGRIHPNNRKRIVRALEVYEVTGIPISRWQTQWGAKDERSTFNVQRSTFNDTGQRAHPDDGAETGARDERSTFNVQRSTSNDTGQRAERKEQGALLAGEKPTTAHCPSSSAEAAMALSRRRISTAYLMIGLRRDRADLYARINRRAEEMFEQGLVEETERLLESGIGETPVARQALGYKEAIGYLHDEYPREEAVRRLAANTRHFARRQLTWWRKDGRIQWIDIGADDTPEDVVNEILILCNDCMRRQY